MLRVSFAFAARFQRRHRRKQGKLRPSRATGLQPLLPVLQGLRVPLQVGGRADIRKEINEINFVASLTDSTIRGYDAAPYLPDAIITADKRINSKSNTHCWPSGGSNSI